MRLVVSRRRGFEGKSKRGRQLDSCTSCVDPCVNCALEAEHGWTITGSQQLPVVCFHAIERRRTEIIGWDEA